MAKQNIVRVPVKFSENDVREVRFAQHKNHMKVSASGLEPLIITQHEPNKFVATFTKYNGFIPSTRTVNGKTAAGAYKNAVKCGWC